MYIYIYSYIYIYIYIYMEKDLLFCFVLWYKIPLHGIITTLYTIASLAMILISRWYLKYHTLKLTVYAKSKNMPRVLLKFLLEFYIPFIKFIQSVIIE